MADILIVAELMDKKARSTTRSALRFAKQVVEAGGAGAYDVIAIGEGAKAAAEELAQYGARKVLVAEVGGGYLAEKYAPTIAEVAKKGGYGIVAATASTYGKDLLPRVAARLGAGVASDVSGVKFEGGKVLYRRPMYAGNVFGTCEVTTPIAVVTVRQSEFEGLEAGGGGSAIEEVPVVQEAAASRVEFVDL